MTTWVKWLIFSENSAIRTNYPLEVASKRALEFYTYFLKQPLLLGLGLWPRLCRFLEPEYFLPKLEINSFQSNEFHLKNFEIISMQNVLNFVIDWFLNACLITNSSQKAFSGLRNSQKFYLFQWQQSKI